MKILKLKLFQETACYKKPFAFKIAETYPLPPYSTVIGMFHKIIEAKNGEYFPMNISIQGNHESIFTNFQTLRMYKKDGQVTAMPRVVHQLLNVELIIHMEAKEEIVDKIYNNIISGKVCFTLGRNEDVVRIDDAKIMKNVTKVKETFLKYNAYVPIRNSEVNGISYRINTTYKIENNLRKWDKVDVKYVEKSTNEVLEDVLVDEENDLIIWYK